MNESIDNDEIANVQLAFKDQFEAMEVSSAGSENELSDVDEFDPINLPPS